MEYKIGNVSTHNLLTEMYFISNIVCQCEPHFKDNFNIKLINLLYSGRSEIWNAEMQCKQWTQLISVVFSGQKGMQQKPEVW